jgi:hypothetical protein
MHFDIPGGLVRHARINTVTDHLGFSNLVVAAYNAAGIGLRHVMMLLYELSFKKPHKGGKRMKKLVLALVLFSFIALPATLSFAANKENTGCGLGYMIMQGNDGLLFQISSGTLECEKPGRFASKEQLNKYVAENMDNLANDIAKGQGEYLNTLAVLMEVPEDSRAEFYVKLQSNFSRIYPSTNVTSVDVLTNIASLM